MKEKVEKLLAEWHEAGRIAFERSYKNLVYDTYSPKTAKYKKKYIYLDEGTSGAFILEISTGNIYSLKSRYGVPNFKKFCGHIDTITGADLCRLRWW